MAQTITVDNFANLNIKSATIINADISSTGANITVYVPDTSNLAAGDYVALGALGGANCEITTISSVAGNTSVVLANVTLSHQRGEAFTDLFGNQINLYRATNVNDDPPADSSFSVIVSATSIIPNQIATQITDSGGGSGYWYKFTYYNPTLPGETQLADSKVVRGGGYGNYATLDEIRAEAGFTNNANISDSDISRKRQRAQNIINGLLYGDYITPFAVPVPPLINTSCIMLAAGYLMLQEYGTSATGTSKDGDAKIAQIITPYDAKSGMREGLGILDMIKMREIILTDDAGNSLLLSDLTDSSPNDSTDPTTLTSDTNSFDPNTGTQLGRYFSMRDQY
jgi:hypothetical protein